METNQSSPLLSVIVPIYNVEDYLDKCIGSIVAQSYRNLEIILVDDGSPDGCPAKCEEWSLRDSRVKVVHKENGGLGYARNTGLEYATGEYVAFVDSDDYCRDDMFQILMEEAIEHDADMVSCGFQMQHPSGEFVPYIDMDYRVFTGKGGMMDLLRMYIPKEVGKTLNCGMWHNIFRRSGISNDIFVSERQYISEDLNFLVDYIPRINKFVYVDKALYYYVYRESGISKSYSFSSFERRVATALRISKLLENTPLSGCGADYAFQSIYNLVLINIMPVKASIKEKYNLICNILDNADYQAVIKSKPICFGSGFRALHRKLSLKLQQKKCKRLFFLYSLLDYWKSDVKPCK